ncbi:fatty acid desaturase family protein [Microlunatus ginsengisoli]|uniref:Acyl-CoA desaturase n=1 Tax=Microlunatus ginsengisoli TaxID=363863 RepID=A0ABP7A3R3_9ACTN
MSVLTPSAPIGIGAEPATTASATTASATTASATTASATFAPVAEPSLTTRSGSSFTALARQVHELGLMRRRYGYYWAKLIGAVLVLTGWVVGFVWIGDSWWQLASGGVLAVTMTQTAFLGHDAAHRQIFKSGRWNDWISLIVANLLVGISYGWWRSKHTRHHANPNKDGYDPDIALTAIAFTPERATRHRSRLMRWLVAHQGWYFFPILLLEGLSLHFAGIKRVVTPGKVDRRWVELAFLTVRLGGLVTLMLWVLPPGKAGAVLAVQLAVFGLYMGSSFAPNHIGMPLVSPKLKLDFLRRQVLMSRNITGGPPMSIFMGGLNYQIEHHLFPSMARPHLRKIQPLVAAYCAAEGVPYTQTSIWSAYRSVVGYLNTVGLQGKNPFLCPLVAQRRAI